MSIVKDLTTLKAIEKAYHLEFDRKFKYYTGDAYRNANGDFIPSYMIIKKSGRIFKLKYFDGCFNPFLYELDPKLLVYSRETDEPVFANYPNPKWDKSKFYAWGEKHLQFSF